MALVQRLLGVEHLGPQQARLGPVRVVRVRLSLRPVLFLHHASGLESVPVELAGNTKGVVLLVAAAVLVVQVGQAQAARVLARGVGLARAAAAEAILSGLDAGAQDHAVDEAKVGREDGLVDLVDDGDGDGLVRGKGAELAEVTGFPLRRVFLAWPLACVLFLLFVSSRFVLGEWWLTGWSWKEKCCLVTASMVDVAHLMDAPVMLTFLMRWSNWSLIMTSCFSAEEYVVRWYKI